MLNLGLPFLRAVGAYNIYTDFFLGIFSKIAIYLILTLYIDLCLLLASLLEIVMFLHHDSCQIYTIIGDSSPLSNPV